MGLTMNERQAVTKQLALEYKRTTKKNKGRILASNSQRVEERGRTEAVSFRCELSRHVG